MMPITRGRLAALDCALLATATPAAAPPVHAAAPLLLLLLVAWVAACGSDCPETPPSRQLQVAQRSDTAIAPPSQWGGRRPCIGARPTTGEPVHPQPFTDAEVYDLAHRRGDYETERCLWNGFRLRVARDSSVMARIAEMYEGRRPDAGPSDTAAMLWWLAEGTRPEHLRYFLEARAPEKGQLWWWSIHSVRYGLARYAHASPDARRRLAQVDSADQPGVSRGHFVRQLMLVNDSAARTMMREMRADGRIHENVDAGLTALVDTVLARPALAPGEGRWECSTDQRIGRTPAGAFGCVADVPGAVVLRDEAPVTTPPEVELDGATLQVSAYGWSVHQPWGPVVYVILRNERRAAGSPVHPDSLARALTELTRLRRRRFVSWLFPAAKGNAPVIVRGDDGQPFVVIRRRQSWSRPWELSVWAFSPMTPIPDSQRWMRSHLTEWQLQRAVIALQRGAELGIEYGKMSIWADAAAAPDGARR